MMNKESTFAEKLALLGLAGLTILALTIIGINLMNGGKVDPNSSAILGSIVTGLAATVTILIQTVRAYSTTAQLGKVTDQLAASGPVVDPLVDPTEPLAVEVVNEADKPVKDKK